MCQEQERIYFTRTVVGSALSESKVARLLGVFLAVFTLCAFLLWSPLLFPANTLHVGPFQVQFPLFNVDERYGDLIYFVKLVRNSASGGSMFSQEWSYFNYPAPATFVYDFFISLHHPLRAYLISFSIAVAGLSLLVWFRIRKSTLPPALVAAVLIAVATLGYPQIFAGDRANLEWIDWALAALGLACFCSRRYLLAAVLFGLAVCMKPFPILLFLLLAGRKRYREAAVGLLGIAILNVVALWRLGPTLLSAYMKLQGGARAYARDYIFTIRAPAEAHFYHSIFDSYKILLATICFPGKSIYLQQLRGSGYPAYARLDRLAGLYSLFAVIAILWIIYRFRRLPLTNQVFALSAAMTVLPYAAADYTLLMMYLPFAMFLIFLAVDVAGQTASFSPRVAGCILAAFALLFLPLVPVFSDFAGVVKTLCLTALIFIASRYPMPSARFDQRSATTV